jgi:5-methylcytosine-specific restriction protein A
MNMSGRAKRKAWTPTKASTKRVRGRAWQSVRSAWLAAHPLCAHCKCDGVVFAGSDENPIEVDHIIGLAQGGTDDESNYQTLCRRHNTAKMVADRSARP